MRVHGPHGVGHEADEGEAERDGAEDDGEADAAAEPERRDSRDAAGDDRVEHRDHPRQRDEALELEHQPVDGEPHVGRVDLDLDRLVDGRCVLAVNRDEEVLPELAVRPDAELAHALLQAAQPVTQLALATASGIHCDAADKVASTLATADHIVGVTREVLDEVARG